MAEEFAALLQQLAEGPLGSLLYPLYLVLVFVTTYYLALVP